jgi:hypothetical protein
MKNFRGEIVPFGNFRGEYISILRGDTLRGDFLFFSRGVNFRFCKWTHTLLVTTKMELYIFAGRALYTWLALGTGVWIGIRHRKMNNIHCQHTWAKSPAHTNT